jgi:hypothetical protein
MGIFLDMIYTMIGTWIGITATNCIMGHRGYFNINQAETIVKQILIDKYKGKCVCF